MDVREIGERLVSLCREGRNMDAIDELYAADVVSVEAQDPPEGERTVTFKPAGQRFTLEEVAVYTVDEGKIVREEFFYAM